MLMICTEKMEKNHVVTKNSWRTPLRFPRKCFIFQKLACRFFACETFECATPTEWWTPVHRSWWTGYVVIYLLTSNWL